jgi:hypothetical protein
MAQGIQLGTVAARESYGRVSETGYAERAFLGTNVT